MMTMAKQRFSDALRRAIEQSEKTRYRISKETGIAEAVLSRFMHGKGGLSVESIDRICESIGARLVVEARPPRKKGK
jgi:transcriptional regulator with XRE-family HTH domain